MTALGLGCVKTPAPAAIVENLKAIAHYESQIILRTYAPMPCQSIFHISPMYEFPHSLGQKANNSL